MSKRGRSRTRSTDPPARSRSRSKSKPRAKKSKASTPRAIIRTSASSSPNVHVFKRSYDHPFSIGVTDADNGVHLNTDSKYLVVKLVAKFSELPDYEEFQHLFSQYKITSIKHSLVPYYSQNMPSVQYTSSITALAIPNYEIFTVPVSTTAQYPDFEGMTSAELDSFLNQTQRKSIRLMPSRTQTYWTKSPKVVGYSGPVDKGAGSASMEMVAPGWLMTTPGIPPGMINDQTTVEHYGVTLLIRRVDGLALPTHGAGDANLHNMGFRMEHDVYFKTRQVR